MTPIPELSFEFFPARTSSGADAVFNVQSELAKFNPAFMSVTYGAGGSTQAGTLNAIQRLTAHDFQAAPHLTCVGSTKAELHDLIRQYINLGVNRLVVLRGDQPKDRQVTGDFQHASDLVMFVRSEFGTALHLEVAAYPDNHPESDSLSSELTHFKQKMDAGADSAITQYFYNADSYFAFFDDCRRMGIKQRITPGIMPILDAASLLRFSNNCGAEIPLWLRTRLDQFKDDSASLNAFGLEVVTQLCDRLLSQGVDSLHFYTLNKVNPSAQICEALGLTKDHGSSVDQIAV